MNKKNIVAVAVAAALTVPAIAMAEVTISGGLQAELRSVGGGGVLPKGLYLSDGGQYGLNDFSFLGASSNNAESGGNYGFLKFSAAENVGGGLKALAVYDMDISIGDTGTASGNTNGTSPTGREAYIGLAGHWGTVLAGTLDTPYKSSTVGWDPFLGTSLQARGNGGMSVLQDGYVSNALAYVNTFHGVKVEAAIVLDEATNGTDATKTNGKNSLSFSVNAPLGPVELAVAYIDLSKNADLIDSLAGSSGAYAATGLSAVNHNHLDATKIGLKWSTGAWTIAGQVEQLGEGFSIDGATHDMYYVTSSYVMGRNTFSVGYGSAYKNLSMFALGMEPEQPAFVSSLTSTSQDVSYVMVGVKHAFSKSVDAFVGYQATDAGNFISPIIGVGSARQDTVTAGLRVGF